MSQRYIPRFAGWLVLALLQTGDTLFRDLIFRVLLGFKDARENERK